MLNCKISICEYVIFTDAGASFAEYEAFLRKQAQNATFVELFNQHIKRFQVQDRTVQLVSAMRWFYLF